jgi:hypothetical protein
MGQHQRVDMCRWAVPTLFLPYPQWLSGEDEPWSCVRGDTPVPLETTDICSDCPYFERIDDHQPEKTVATAPLR